MTNATSLPAANSPPSITAGSSQPSRKASRSTLFGVRSLLVVAVIVSLASWAAIKASSTIASYSQLSASDDSLGEISSTPPPAARRSTASGVGALGRLEPGWKILKISPASSPEGAVVAMLCVDEGDQVRQGDVLAVLDALARREAALREAKAQARAASARFVKVKAGPSSAEVAVRSVEIEQQIVSLSSAEADYNRALKLREAKVSTLEDFEKTKTQFDRARLLVAQSKSQLAALTTIREEDVQAAEAEIAKAEASVARAEAEVEACKIRSPIDARVLKVFARPGERVGDSGLVEIGDTDNMQAVAEVHERDASLIQIGQSAIVRVQSLSEEFQGTVVRTGWKVGRQVVLDNDPVRDTDARVVEVRIKLDPAASSRLAGLSYARVEIRIDARKDR